MNRSWSYWLKSVYRREPLLAIAITAGSLDLLLGTVHGSSSLALLGLSAAGSGLALTWWKAQRTQAPYATPAPPLYLPDRTSRPQILLSDLPRRKSSR